MQAQHFEFDAFLDEAADPMRKLVLERHEGKQHPHRKAAVQNEQRAEPDHGDVFQAEQQAVQRLVDDAQLLHADAGVEMVHHQILVTGPALQLAVEQLHALHAAHSFQQIALLFGAAQDLLLGRQP